MDEDYDEPQRWQDEVGSQGYHAYQNGAMQGHNPYEADTEEWQVWLDGWRHAESQAENETDEDGIALDEIPF